MTVLVGFATINPIKASEVGADNTFSALTNHLFRPSGGLNFMLPFYGTPDEGANVPSIPPAPKTSGYQAFLRSHYWWKVSNQVLQRDGHQCQVCSRNYSLQVHHLTYKNHCNEANHLEDLITLCGECHSAAHGKEARRGKGRLEALDIPVMQMLAQNFTSYEVEQ